MAPKGPVYSFSNPDLRNRLNLYKQTVLILLGLVFIFPIYVASAVYRRFVSKISSLLCPELYHILPLHASLYINQNVHSDVWSNILLRFKLRGRLNLEALKARFVERFVNATNHRNGRLMYPELQQYPWKWAGYHFWRWESDFKIGDHIIHHKADNEQVRLTSAELDDLEVQFLKTSFELEKSPWQILLVDNVEPNEDGPSVLVLFKIHHSLSDGQSLFNALMECVDERVQTLKVPASPQQPILTWLFHWITFPVRAAYEFAKLTQCKSVESPWDVDCVDQSATKVRRRHVVRSSPLSKERVKKLASFHGVSFTAITLSAIAGGIRQYLLRNKKPDEVPEYMVCEVPVPVESHPEGLCNAVCVVSFILPTGCPDPRRRIAICEQSVANRKASIEPNLTHFVFNLFGLLPDILPKIPYKFSPVALSVFPGPLAPIKFCGQELFEMSYVLLSVPVVFAVSMLTYADGLQFFCTGDNRIFTLQDIQQIVNSIEYELGLMEQDAAKDSAFNGNSKLPLPTLIN